MSDLIQKQFKFVQINDYGDLFLDVPEGYQFFQFLEKNMPSYNQGQGPSTVILAVFVSYEPMLEAVKRVEKKSFEDLKKRKEYLEKEYQEKIANMNLEITFSEVIKKFRLGDTIYYYADGYSVEPEAKAHIKSFTLAEVHLTKSKVQMKEDRTADNDYSSYHLELVGWGEKSVPSMAWKTREEAIEGSKDYHRKRLKEKFEKEAEAKKLAEEAKKKEEEEILRKAEEIKNKK